MAKVVKTTQTGVVQRIETSVGAVFQEGDVLVVLETMKIEVPVEAEMAGTVVAILCTVGESVKEGTPLVEFESS